jgi:hypothetical protein
MPLLGAADSTSIDACTKVVKQVGDTILAPAMCHVPQRVYEVWKTHMLCHPPVGDDAHSPPKEILTDLKKTKKTLSTRYPVVELLPWGFINLFVP